MLMEHRRADPAREVQGVPINVVIRRLAARAARDGESELRALADLRAAVDQEIAVAVTLALAVGGRTWRALGDDLGVSPQAAHRKYGKAASG